MYLFENICGTKFYLLLLCYTKYTLNKPKCKLLHCKPTPNKSQSKSTNQDIYLYIFSTNSTIIYSVRTQVKPFEVRESQYHQPRNYVQMRPSTSNLFCSRYLQGFGITPRT